MSEFKCKNKTGQKTRQDKKPDRFWKPVGFDALDQQN